MSLLIPFEPGGLDPKTVHVLDDLIAAVQTWAGKVDGINQAGIATAVQTGAGSMWFGTTAPTGYLLCDGTAVSRVTYSALFTIMGTAYGAGDGSTTFNLPDLRQRFPLGKAASGTGATLGSTGGAIDHTHTGPSHTHTGPSHTHGAGTLSAPATGSPPLVVTVGATDAASPTHTHSITGSTAADGTGNTGASGTGDTGTANPPYQVVNWIVKT